MRFLVDAQLPPALARWLAEHGHVAEHVTDVMLAAATDRQVWEYASGCGAIIVTKDQDFATRRATSAVGPAVVWCRIGNTRRNALLTWFEAQLTELLAALERGEAIVEIR